MKKDIRYVPSNPEVIEAMLDLAWAGPGDVVYDLGSGDGRVVIAAAQRGCTALGVDIDLRLVERSRLNAEEAGVADRAKFLHQSFQDTPLRPASVVFLYLFHSINRGLKPRLLKELKPGSRILSQNFDMGDWEPNQILDFEGKLLFLWIVP